MTRCAATWERVDCDDPVPPNATSVALLVDELGRNSRKSKVQYDAPGSVRIAGPAVVDRIFASSGDEAGEMRMPAAGSDESGLDERMVIGCVPPFALRLNGPLNVAPAWRTIVSSGRAALIAPCRSPPAL